jgi:MoxR-like ATPase
VSDPLAATVPDVSALQARLDRVGYLADEGLATALFCAVRLGQPVLLEGEAGAGKTSAATALGSALPTVVIRLQCYEGIDVAEAVYEWNYPRQLLAIRLAESSGRPLGANELFGRPYLVDRPLLRAVEHPGPMPAVLLIDEIDRADHEFEAFLLEFLSDFQISIPERGTIRAAERPVVILTSNRTRELHEALRRRCIYHWIDYPSPAQEAEIVMMRASGIAAATARAVVAAVGRLRREPLAKPPGIAETIDWAEGATLLNRRGAPWPEAFRRAIGAALKDEDDLAFLGGRLDAIIEEAAA